MKPLVEAFDAQGNAAVAWWNTGWNLLLSADLLSREWHPPRTLPATATPHDLTWVVHGPRLMLRACGIECLLKALYVARGGLLAKNGSFRPPEAAPKDRHHLIGLAGLAGISLDRSETLLLKRLRVWFERGRYPIAVAWNKEFIKHPNGYLAGAAWSDQNEGAFEVFRQRLRSRAEEVLAPTSAQEPRAGEQ